jgi:hypothetical protein
LRVEKVAKKSSYLNFKSSEAIIPTFFNFVAIMLIASFFNKEAIMLIALNEK